MLKAVLFDMDDTLLSLNLSMFIALLIKDEASLIASIMRRNVLPVSVQLSNVLLDLNNNSRADDDTATNRAYLNAGLRERVGIDLDDPCVRDVFDYYESEVLSAKNDGVIAARPREGAREAIEAALGRGLRIALFTNPCFSRACIETRLAWAHLSDAPFEVVTTLENSTRCKPSPTYYKEHIERMGLEPGEVLMVGNDPRRDVLDPSCGIQTAYVGSGTPAQATWCGSMADLAARFDEVVSRFYARQEKASRDARAERG